MGVARGLGSSPLPAEAADPDADPTVAASWSPLPSVVLVLLVLAGVELPDEATAGGEGVTLVRGLVCLTGLTGRFVLRAALAASLAIRQISSRKVQRRRNILSAIEMGIWLHGVSRNLVAPASSPGEMAKC